MQSPKVFTNLRDFFLYKENLSGFDDYPFFLHNFYTIEEYA